MQGNFLVKTDTKSKQYVPIKQHPKMGTAPAQENRMDLHTVVLLNVWIHVERQRCRIRPTTEILPGACAGRAECSERGQFGWIRT